MLIFCYLSESKLRKHVETFPLCLLLLSLEDQGSTQISSQSHTKNGILKDYCEALLGFCLGWIRVEIVSGSMIGLHRHQMERLLISFYLEISVITFFYKDCYTFRGIINGFQNILNWFRVVNWMEKRVVVWFGFEFRIWIWIFLFFRSFELILIM